MAARVVDLPEPVSPVTRTIPLWRLVNSSAEGGSPRESSLGMDSLSRRMAAETLPCCLNTWHLQRIPLISREKSSSPVYSSFSYIASFARSWQRISQSFSERRSSAMFSSWPSRRYFGGRPHTRWMSDAPLRRACSVRSSMLYMILVS